MLQGVRAVVQLANTGLPACAAVGTAGCAMQDLQNSGFYSPPRAFSSSNLVDRGCSSPHRAIYEVLSPHAAATSPKRPLPFALRTFGAEGLQLDLTGQTIVSLRGAIAACLEASDFPHAQLLSVVLHGCRLATLHALSEAFQQLHTLVHLQITQNPDLQRAPSSCFAQLWMLQELNISNNALRALPSLALPQLHTLLASGNALRSAAGVECLMSLAVLDLADNAIQSMAGLRALVPLAAANSLTCLNISGNPVANTPRFRPNIAELVPSLTTLNEVPIQAQRRVQRSQQRQQQSAVSAAFNSSARSGYSSDRSAVSNSRVASRCSTPQQRRCSAPAEPPPLPLPLHCGVHTASAAAAAVAAVTPLKQRRAGSPRVVSRTTAAVETTPKRLLAQCDGYCSDSSAVRSIQRIDSSDSADQCASPTRSHFSLAVSCNATATAKAATVGASKSCSGSVTSGTPRSSNVAPPMSPARARQAHRDTVRAQPCKHFDREKWKRGAEQATAILKHAAQRQVCRSTIALLVQLHL
jgi:hypothetical protein